MLLRQLIATIALATVSVFGTVAQVHLDSCKYVALSTNLLYDMAAVPNIGIEIPIGEHLSVKADWMYAWWSNTDKCRFWRIYGGDLGVRYYFASEPSVLSGHHVGFFGQIVT